MGAPHRHITALGAGIVIAYFRNSGWRKELLLTPGDERDELTLGLVHLLPVPGQTGPRPASACLGVNVRPDTDVTQDNL